MLECEAPKIAAMLRTCSKLSVLNVCSGNHHYRKLNQPFIHYVVLQPLMDRGCTIANLDQKRANGVDIVDDCQEMKSVKDGAYDLAIWTNAIEHMLRPADCIRAIHRVLKPGGSLLASGPGAYPYHADLIDTMLRIQKREQWQSILAGFFEVVAFDSTEKTPVPNGGWASIVLARRIPNGNGH